MKHILRLSLLAAFAVTTGAVHAEDLYIGAALNGAYHAKLILADGSGGVRTFESKSKGMPVRLYGGYNFNANFAVEAGYKDFGKLTFGSADDAGTTLSMDARFMYVAAKGTVPLGESWSVFGKLGAANGRTRYMESGGPENDKLTAKRTSPYVGIGVAYLVSKNIALTVELERVGATRVGGLNFGMSALSAGASFSF